MQRRNVAPQLRILGDELMPFRLATLPAPAPAPAAAAPPPPPPPPPLMPPPLLLRSLRCPGPLPRLVERRSVALISSLSRRA